MNQSISYTEPKLYHGSNAWFVGFEITNHLTGKTKRMQSRKGINYITRKDEKIRHANALIKWWKDRLENGWMPDEWISDVPKNSLIFPVTKFNDALDFALDNCVVARKTKSGYKGSVKFFKEAAVALHLNMAIKDIDRPHIMLMLKWIKEKRNWSNHAYNKHLGYICAVIARLMDWKVIKFNPAEKIKTLPVAETRKFIPYTDEEKIKIREHLFTNHYRFFVFMLSIYHCGLRPKEALALKIKDIDLANQLITILPDLEAENSKTKKIRYIPINNHLLIFLREFELQNYPGEYFLFGSPFEKGHGRRGNISSKHPDYFKPSAVRVKRDTVTKLWKEIIIDDLGIKKYLYAGKHSGADAKILAGIDLDTLKELYGHSSKFMTEKYVSVLMEVHKKKIIEHSPEF
jgi:integrase